MVRTAALAAALAAVVAAPAAAASSGWVAAEGGRVRLVTTGLPDAAGRLSGIVDIQLKPGWKTYWRDPGDAGVPPQLDAAASVNLTAAELAFPAPGRHDDGYSVWAGYDHAVAFPVTLTLSDPARPIEASVFLGVCETICVPLQATLSLDPADGADDPDDAARVRAAGDALPAAARAGFEALPEPGIPGKMTVRAVAPGDPAALDLFVAGVDGYSFAAPKRVAKDGATLFVVPVLDAPAAPPAGRGLPYTLVGADGAVSGHLPYP